MKSDTIGELAKALCKAQSQMKFAKKDSKNPFFKSNYADLAAVVEAIKEPFAANGLSYTQLPCVTEQRAGVETYLMHESGEYISSVTMLPMSKIDPQGAGSAITYARRYALQAIAGIPSDDDDGEAAMYRKPKQSAEAKKIEQLYKNKDGEGLLAAYNAAKDKQKLWAELSQGVKNYINQAMA